MDLERLGHSQMGSLIPISGNDGRTGRSYAYFAYLANPLPSEVTLSAATWTVVAETEAALARLDQAARQIPDPSLLRRPSLRREAQSTSALEGTYAPLEEVLGSETDEREHLSLEMREILNYVAAAEDAFAWVADRPLTVGMLCETQRTLVLGTPGEHSDAGQLRDWQVFIGPRTVAIEDARFVPAPVGDHLRAGIEDWVRWLSSPHLGMSPVVQAALAHYQFETLHPFSDGNGRIGRLVIVLQFMRLSVLDEPMLAVSPWFEARRDEYQDALLTLTETGVWDAWVLFFAMGVRDSATATHRRIDRLLSWQKTALETVRAAGISGVAERVAGELIGTPILRAARVAKAHNVTHQAAMNALRRLTQAGLLMETTRNGSVHFVGRAVIDLISD